ncbi:hypothetical protein [Caballeronia glebae]|uniref:hypothetical protein n=1 Tax=Caballeronia glebae TaxID=1777143 RepID=UPI000AA3C6A6|nr:hypothetical protein [Caballeronia glebae]
MKNAKQMGQAQGQRATIRSTEATSPSQLIIGMHERRLHLIEARDVRISHRL